MTICLPKEARPMPSDRPVTIHVVARTGAPSHRTKVLEQLLEHYNDLVDPMQMRDQPGDGTGLILMPATYTATVRELERLIRRMRDDRQHPLIQHDGEKVSLRQLWWHLNAWYIAVEHTSFVPPQRTAKNKGKHLRRQPVDQHGVPLRQVRVLRSPQAREQIALKAVEWLSASWGLAGEPMLPRELVQAA